MTNVTKKYDWNNHKEMNQKRMLEVFLGLGLSDKLKVYRILKEKRRLLLRKGYEKRKETVSEARFEKHKLYITSPLGEGIMDTEDIKTRKEMMLTLGIIIIDSGFGYYEDISSNHSREYDSFEKTKEKMLGYIETMSYRGESCLEPEENSLYWRLKNLKYVSPPTIISILKDKKERWVRCYVNIGVGKDRAERLAIALTKRAKILEEYDVDTLYEKKIIYSNWKKKIGGGVLNEATLLYVTTQLLSG